MPPQNLLSYHLNSPAVAPEKSGELFQEMSLPEIHKFLIEDYDLRISQRRRRLEVANAESIAAYSTQNDQGFHTMAIKDST
jgi:hypothetical protein